MTTDVRRIERFDRLWDGCYARVLGYALRRTDREDAREVAAEVFTVAWRRLEDVPTDAELPWLLATARGTIANRRRAAARRPLPQASDLPTAPEPDPAERVAARDALARAFARLSEDDREALMLLAWDGLRPREAAIVLGCSAATFSVRAHRARGRLASFLSGEDGPGPAFDARPSTEEVRHDGS
jgi:RNA polymerase sigma-70 factor (ECF subfamily)